MKNLEIIFREVVDKSATDRGYWQVVPDWFWIERALMILHNHNPVWKFNVADKGSLWSLEEGLFICWLKGWNDIKAIFGGEHPITFTNAATAARQYGIQEVLISPSTLPDTLPYWLIRPDNCEQLRARASHLNAFYAVKLSRNVFGVPTPVIAADVSEIKRGRQRNERWID